MVTFDPQCLTVTDRDGRTHELWHEVFWYLAPTTTQPVATTHPLNLAMTLHNARLGEGLLIAFDDLLDGISAGTSKSGLAGDAERLFERVRAEEFPDRPSRLRSYFLSRDEAAARQRAREWAWTERQLVPCYLVLSSGRYHCADVRDYEAAARHGPTEEHARSYWADLDSTRVPADCVEVVADSALYFPEWRTFPLLDPKAIGPWAAARAKPSKSS